jgi:hypothetical protein
MPKSHFIHLRTIVLGFISIMTIFALSFGSGGAQSARAQENAAKAPPTPKVIQIPNTSLYYKHVCDRNIPEGLNHCDADIVTDAAGNALAFPNTLITTAYGPAQFRGAYGVSGTTSVTRTIAIVDAFDDPYAFSDLNAYSSHWGIPTMNECPVSGGTHSSPCFQKVDQNGGTNYPSFDAGWAQEISLDVQIAHALCENCNILLVEAKSAYDTDLIAAADQRAVAMGADVVSNSWGGNESSSDPSLNSYFNHPGVPFTFSTGDAGYGVQYPAASPNVVAVGGTTLNINVGNTYSSESAWSGAGSGCSAYETKPGFQFDTGCLKRTVADVSADANPSTGAYVVYNGSAFQIGGTSLAAPLIASIYALGGGVGTTLGNSVPYSNYVYGTNLHDVTTGSNGTCSPSYLCHGVSGYDGPTGLGTPKGTAAFALNTTPPGAFNKSSPSNSTTGVSVTASLQWTASSNFDHYEYCYDTSNPCSNWTNNGTSTSAAPGFVSGQTYYWNVRAVSSSSIYTYADASQTDWSFTTLSGSNDNFATATLITSLPYTNSEDTSTATGAGDDPTLSCPAIPGSYYNTVWYRYTPPSSVNLTVDTLGSNYDTVLGVWTGSQGSLTSVACNDDYSGTLSLAQFNASAGTTYYIETASHNPGGGNLTLNVYATIPDAFNKSSPSNGATGQSSSPTLQWSASNNFISYEYCYGASDPCSNWTDNGTSTSVVLSSLTAGQTYYWNVRAINGNATPTYADASQTDWSFTTQGTNDSFGLAKVISSLPYTDDMSTTTAITASDDPIFPCTGYVHSNTVWYQYTPSFTTSMTIDTIGSDYDTVLAVWTGSQGSLTSVACNDDISYPSNVQSRVQFTATAGTTYYVEAASYFQGGGNLTLNANGNIIPPGAFNKSNPSNGAAGQSTSPTLQWTASGNFDHYEYCYDTSNPCSNWVTNGTSTSVGLSLTAGQTYYWNVRAVNGGGSTYTYANGSQTDWSFTIANQAPGAFNKTSPSDGSTATSKSIQWSASSEATYYEYCYGTTNPCTNWTNNGTSTSVALSGLTSGQTYYWHVRAVNNYNNTLTTTYSDGSSSAVWSFLYIVPTTVTFQSTGSYDGWILALNSSNTVGGSINASANTLQLGDDAKNRQYKSIVSFNTASLPPTAVIISAALRLDQNTVTGINPFSIMGNLWVDIQDGWFGLKPNPEKGDFSAPASAAQVASFNSTPSGGWYTANINAAGISNINRSSVVFKGVTQFRLYFNLASNNNFKADLIRFFSGNYSKVTMRPQLVISYYIP